MDKQRIIQYQSYDSFKTQGINVNDHFREVTKMIEIAKGSKCKITDHFREVTKMVELGSGAKREITDYMLTR